MLLIVIVASPMMKPAFLLRFLPEDVRLAAKDHPEPPKSKQILAYVIFAVFIIAMIGGRMYAKAVELLCFKQALARLA